MVDEQGKLREIDWHDICPSLMLLRTVRMALIPRVLVLGALGLIVTTLGWRVITEVFSASTDPVVQQWSTSGVRWAWEDTPEFSVAMSVRNSDELFASAQQGILRAPAAMWLHLTRPFVDLFRADLTATGFICLLLCCVWELLVWGIFGGAITRIAALRFTRGEAPHMFAALGHAFHKWFSYSLAPLVALGFAGVVALLLALLGFCMQLDFLAMLAAFVWPIVLLLGLLMAVLLLGALVGWPLMWATVSVEGTDAFDALSRSYAYTYQRPLRLLMYVLFAAVLGALSMFVVKLFAGAAIAFGDWAISWGIDEATMRSTISLREMPADETVQPTGMLGVAAAAIYFWKSLLASIAAGYQAGFVWVAAVGVYLLLRRDIDQAEMDEVYIDEEQDYGIPPLASDMASGVPEVSPDDDAQPGDTGGSPPEE